MKYKDINLDKKKNILDFKDLDEIIDVFLIKRIK